MKRSLYLIGVSLLVILSGCDQAALMKKWTPPEDESIAKNYIELLRQGKFDQIEAALDSSLKSPDIRDTFAQMAALVPAGPPESLKVVGSHVFNGPEVSATNLTFEYQFPHQWLLINVATQKKNGVATIIGFHVTPIADSLENINRFTLAGKSGLQYLVLMLAILVPLFSLYVAIRCIRTKDVKRKWLWVIFIAFGVGKLTVNWVTGEWSVMPLAIQIPAGHAFHQLYGPWIVEVFAPLGAISFLLRRRKPEPPLAETISPHSAQGLI
jgi:hypothetical protein